MLLHKERKKQRKKQRKKERKKERRQEDRDEVTTIIFEMTVTRCREYLPTILVL